MTVAANDCRDRVMDLPAAGPQSVLHLGSIELSACNGVDYR